jgi:Tfp pilus assembly protein FimT
MMERSRIGQSLIELLIGIAIGAVFIIGVITIVAPVLRINEKTTLVQTQTALANELAGNVKSLAVANWANVASLATGTTKTYYLTTSTSPFLVVGSGTSTEAITMGTTTFVRYFYVSEVYRDSNGNVTSTVSGANLDPSSRLATILVNVSGTTTSATTTLWIYITRNASNNFNQVSWAGSAGQNTPVTLVSSSFATSSNITISNGAITLLSQGIGVCSQ